MSDLKDLNNYLFGALDRLSKNDLKGDELKDEINRASTMGNVASAIIQNYALQMKAEQMKLQAIPNRASSEIIVPIEDINKPRVIRDKNFYKSSSNA